MTEPLRKILDDAAQRELAVDAARSVLVQAPAGSGKTTLLTQRFLALLARVNEPGEIVAITFTKAAATEMQHRILEELEKAELESNGVTLQKRHRILQQPRIATRWRWIGSCSTSPRNFASPPSIHSAGTGAATATAQWRKRRSAD